MKSIPSRLLPNLPEGKLALGVPALTCACKNCNYSISAHLAPEMEALALESMEKLLRALPDGINQSLETFGKVHHAAGHEISIGLVYLVPMVGASADAPAEEPPS